MGAIKIAHRGGQKYRPSCDEIAAQYRANWLGHFLRNREVGHDVRREDDPGSGRGGDAGGARAASRAASTVAKTRGSNRPGMGVVESVRSVSIEGTKTGIGAIAGGAAAVWRQRDRARHGAGSRAIAGAVAGVSRSAPRRKKALRARRCRSRCGSTTASCARSQAAD
jgi:hypothetical protein